MPEELLNILMPIIYVVTIVFSAWLLPWSLKEFTFGPTIYLVLNFFLWIGISLLIAYIEIGVPDGKETNLIGPLVMGFICFGVGLFKQMTPKDLYGKNRKSKDDETP